MEYWKQFPFISKYLRNRFFEDDFQKRSLSYISLFFFSPSTCFFLAQFGVVLHGWESLPICFHGAQEQWWRDSRQLGEETEAYQSYLSKPSLVRLKSCIVLSIASKPWNGGEWYNCLYSRVLTSPIFFAKPLTSNSLFRWKSFPNYWMIDFRNLKNKWWLNSVFARKMTRFSYCVGSTKVSVRIFRSSIWYQCILWGRFDFGHYNNWKFLKLLFLTDL